MKTCAPRTISSPSADSFTSEPGNGMPMLPGLLRPCGLQVAAPVTSVMPHSSSSSMPSARNQRMRSAEIGAAPVIATSTRPRPIIFRKLSSTSFRAIQ